MRTGAGSRRNVFSAVIEFLGLMAFVWLVVLSFIFIARATW